MYKSMDHLAFNFVKPYNIIFLKRALLFVWKDLVKSFSYDADSLNQRIKFTV